MELFIHKFVSVSNKKILDRNCSEIYFAGTNLGFPFADNDDHIGIDSKYSVELKDIKAEIDSISKISKTIMIKGGEPCLQSLGIKSLAMHIKSNGLFLGIETYGTKPGVIKNLIDEKLVDIITLKLYCPLINAWMKKLNKGSLLDDFGNIIADIKRTIGILQKAKIKINVRTIIVPMLLYKKSDIESIARSISKINNCTLNLISFFPENCKKNLAHIKEPSKEFMERLKKDISEKYPLLKVK
jgi:pyruvate-formate lyase-activating enzyme